MGAWGKALGALLGGLLCLGGDARATEPPSSDVRRTLDWIAATGDAGGRAFAVVDKNAAMLWIYDGGARLVAATPVLLGSARGDRAVEGVGERDGEPIAPHQRITPAGRFGSEPGHNLDGEHVVWFDYRTGLAIHRLRPGAAEASRRTRLASPDPADNRASLGCVVVPEAFYDAVVRPVLGARRGVVYVLPEEAPATRWLEAAAD